MVEPKKKPVRNSKESKLKGVIRAVQKPSYCLKKGIGNFQSHNEEKSLRFQHRKKLWSIFNKLISQNDWNQSCGVLSVLLRATSNDPSLSRNRAKYRASLELLHYINGGNVSLERVNDVYGIWMTKINRGVKLLSPKEKFEVNIERIMLLLQRGDMEKAYQATRSLRVEKGYDSDPISNLVFGLVYYQQWYSGIPEEMQLVDIEGDGVSMQSEGLVDSLHVSSAYSEGNGSNGIKGGSPLKSYSDSSIANDKVIEDDGCKQAEDMESGENSTGEVSSRPTTKSHERDTYSAEASERSNDRGDIPHASIFDARSLPRWLLPLQLPESHEDFEDTIYNHKKLQNDDYFRALEHLRVAFHSTPPVIEAFHPLIQLLLLGDQVKEALDEVEIFSRSSDSILQLRLEASMLEHFDRGNYARLITCFENTLKKDPTCGDPLSKLALMHQRGEYDTQNLVEMIALHLDASRGTCDTWKELASGLLKLSQCEADRVSTCNDGNSQYTSGYLDTCNKIPELLTKGESGKAWRFRCRWWLNRHFNYKNLTSDVASGYLEFVTYKASAAAHLYGRHFSYVLKVIECLEKENNMELYSVLQTHVLNSVGLCSVEKTY